MVWKDQLVKINDIALNNLGKCYSNGVGVTKNLTKAFECFTRAANQKHGDAMYNLGYCYDLGDGVTPDSKKLYFGIRRL